MNILFIDDDDIRTAPLREGLPSMGDYSVTHIRNPIESIEIFGTDPKQFQLIVVDIMMPHYAAPEYRDFSIPKYFQDNNDGIYTGLKVLMQLEAIMIQWSISIPIIVLTHIPDVNKYITELVASGALLKRPSAVLIKPVFIKDFVDVIERLGQHD
ncbi:MAG: hypothetical protein NT002_00475 [candidate division Zixibacteria bacterium]|nr:hypothetical protein [candidate division Zixibacteria bacterium]